MTQAGVMRTRRFAPFFWTQLLGALNDNVFKNALVILFAFGGAPAGLSGDVLVNLAGGVFILPFFVFSATAGQLADKLDKARLIRAVKALEVGIMLFGALGFARRSAALLLVALFGMGLHSTLFGPVKYSILPQVLRDDELVGGNALVEMGTFVAILLGTLLGGMLVAVPAHGPTLASATTIAIAALGWGVARAIPPAPAEDPGLRLRWNPITETWRLLDFAREVPSVFVALVGSAWFWFYGALVLAQLPAVGRDVLGGDPHTVTLLLAVFSIGIGVGCLLCGRLSAGVIELGLVPLGATGLSLFALDLAWAAHRTQAIRTGVDLALLGMAGGFFIVPLLAFVQHRTDPRHRSRVIAAGNVLSAAFMVVAAIVGVVARTAGVTLPALFAGTAIVNAAVAAALFAAVPEFLVRVGLWVRARLRLRRQPR